MATLLPSMTTLRNSWFPGSPDKFSSKGVFKASWYLWKLVTVLFACGWRGDCLGLPSPAPRSPSTWNWCLLLRAKVLLDWAPCLLGSSWPFDKEASPLDKGWTSLKSLATSKVVPSPVGPFWTAGVLATLEALEAPGALELADVLGAAGALGAADVLGGADPVLVPGPG